jgi:hypothetical protein
MGVSCPKHQYTAETPDRVGMHTVTVITVAVILTAPWLNNDVFKCPVG